MTTSEPEVGPHWDPAEDKPALHVAIRFDFLSPQPLIRWDELKRDPFGDFPWGIQASGVALPTGLATALEQLWNRRSASEDPLLADEIAGDAAFPEGARKRVSVNAYERNPQARAACLAHFGYACSVCDVVLEQRYGAIAAEFIHVHHIVSLASVPPNYRVNPKKDLRPVCPNCHAIIHLHRPPLSIQAARRLVHRSSVPAGRKHA